MLYMWIGGFNRYNKFGDKYIPLSGDYFDEVYEKNWIKDDDVQRIVRTIDNNAISADGHIESEVLGSISMRELSTGAKTLILMKMVPDMVWSGERVGDNCWKEVLRLSEKHNICLASNSMWAVLAGNRRCREE